MTDYAVRFDRYWADNSRWGVSSCADPILAEIVSICGHHRLLDVGCGMGDLVFAALREGIDATGLDVARRVVDYGNARAPGRFVAGDACALPFANGEFEIVATTACLNYLDGSDLPKALSELRRVCGRHLYVRVGTQAAFEEGWPSSAHARQWWEEQLFAAGFRKHPLSHWLVDFTALEFEHATAVMAFERLSDSVLTTYSLQSLAAKRDLHMDMLREAGRRSDAHVARYTFAAQYARPHDLVLDLGCGLGYGTAILWDSTQCDRVVGVDADQDAIDYGTTCYASGRAGVEFFPGDAHVVDWSGDSSFHLVVAFEILEHVDNPQALLREMHRLLKPGGRIVVSVPNQWKDETGEDPSPHHLHVFDWHKLHRMLSDVGFLVQEAFSQTAGGGMRLSKASRELREVALDDARAVDGEWWLAVAMRDPICNEIYEESVYPAAARSSARHPHHYKDLRYPWAQHALVSFAFRSRSPMARSELRERLVRAVTVDDADMGSVLTTEVYERIAGGSLIDVDDLLLQLEEFCSKQHRSSIGNRWRISSTFALGLLRLARGDQTAAAEAFESVWTLSFDGTTPTIATKHLQAGLILARLAIQRGEVTRARDWWHRCLVLAQQVVRFNNDDILLDSDAPLHDGLCELSDMLDMAAEAASSLRLTAAAGLRPTSVSHSHRFTRRGEVAALKAQLAKTAEAFKSALADASAAREVCVLAEQRLIQRDKDFSNLAADRAIAQQVMEEQTLQLLQEREAFASLERDRRAAQNVMEEQRQTIMDQEKAFGALLTDRKKAQEIIEHLVVQHETLETEFAAMQDDRRKAQSVIDSQARQLSGVSAQLRHAAGGVNRVAARMATPLRKVLRRMKRK
jgi:ubiquinone/menaquinone biosynthesis C-methylase UbiE